MLYSFKVFRFFSLILLVSSGLMFISCGISNHHQTSNYNKLSSIAAVSVSSDKTIIRAMNKVRYLYPAYYSSTMGDFIVTYNNDTLPWGTTVLLKYGFKTDYHPTIADWADQNSLQAKAIAPYSWETKFEHQIASRGGPSKSHLQFVIQIILPDNSIIYDKGSDTPLGYYEIEIVPCAPNIGDSFCDRPVQVIEKY